MNSRSLVKIVNSLKKTLRELEKHRISDSKIRARYAEYLVAYELAKRGHDVRLGQQRTDRGADIYLADLKKRIEVKSGKYEDGWTDASFNLGRQIAQNKFDFCVFVTFSEPDDSEVDECFVFNRDELREITRPKKDVSHPDTNPCLLLRSKSFGKYQNYVRKQPSAKTRIEYRLNKYPKRYNGAWNKVK